MKTTCLAFFALCALLLQSYGLDDSKAFAPTLEAVDSVAASAEGAPEAKEVIETSEPNHTGIELELKLPLAKNNQTITESSETTERTAEDIVGDYNFSKINTELDPLNNQQQNQKWTEGERLLLDTLLGFLIEVTLTGLVLYIVCTLSGITEATNQIAACSFIVALIGATFGFILQIDPIHPIRLVLSFIVLIPSIRLILGIRKWPKILQISLITRVLSFSLILIAYLGASTLFGL